MLRYFFLILGFLIVLVVAIVGWRGHRFSQPPLEIFPDMDVQPKVKAQVPSAFFADGRGDRPPVPGTVPMGFEAPVNKGDSLATDGPFFSVGDDYLNTGKMDGNWGTGFPMAVTDAMMQRGREQYGIYCAICHGGTGAGNGVAQKFGVVTVQSLLQERIRVMADGEIFGTISHGKNTMLGYGDRIPVPDRWAVIAYLRALQLSQGGATLEAVPEQERAKLKEPPQP